MSTRVKVNVPDLETIQSVNDTDKVLLYSVSGNKLGLAPVNLISGSGWCGRRWANDASSPIGEAVGNIEKLRNLPDILGLGGYLVNDNHSRRKLSASNHHQLASGGVAALDGTMGHYHWGWGTPFYYAAWDDGGYHYEAIDTVPIKGRYNYRIPVASMSASGFATMDRVNNKLVSYCNTSAQYRGGNNDETLDETYKSQLGVPASQKSATSFETAAMLNGDRWHAGFHGMWYMVGALVRIIMGTRNVQSPVNTAKDSDGLYQGGLGGGVSSPANWVGDWNYFPFIPMDAGASDGDMVGESSVNITDSTGEVTKNIPNFFGLKNFYHYLYQIIPSAVLSYNADKSCSIYAVTKMDSTAFNNTTIVGKEVAGIVPSVKAADWKYISKISHGLLCPVPIELDGSPSTYYSDGFYHYNTPSALRGFFAGLNANNGDYAGCCGIYGYRAVSSSYSDYGAFLCEAAEDWDLHSFLAI